MSITLSKSGRKALKKAKKHKLTALGTAVAAHRLGTNKATSGKVKLKLAKKKGKHKKKHHH